MALVRPPGPLTGPAGRARVAEVVRAMRADPDVARVDSVLSAPRGPFVSRDGRATYVAATFRAGVGEEAATDRLTARLDGAPGVMLGAGGSGRGRRRCARRSRRPGARCSSAR
jgi:hypothetical protein